MKITHELPTAVSIRSVSDREIRIGNQVYEKTIALTPDTVMDTWPDTPIAELGEEDFSALLQDNPELIVLGTGTRSVFPPRELVFALARRGIGLEFMDTAAAARTFNVLAGERRSVAAVLYMDVG